MSLEKLMSKEIKVKDIFTLVRQRMSIFLPYFTSNKITQLLLS